MHMHATTYTAFGGAFGSGGIDSVARANEFEWQLDVYRALIEVPSKHTLQKHNARSNRTPYTAVCLAAEMKS